MSKQFSTERAVAVCRGALEVLGYAVVKTDLGQFYWEFEFGEDYARGGLVDTEDAAWSGARAHCEAQPIV